MGHVYLLRNSFVTVLVKVGATTRELSERLAEYSLPGSTEMFWSRRTDAPSREFILERAICAALEQHKVDGKREWFNVKPEYAIRIAEEAIASEEKLAAHDAMRRAPATLMVRSMEEVGEFIKNERRRQGLTQEQLAMVSAVGVRFIVDLEAGKETAQIGKVINVLNNLGNKIVLTQNSS